MRRDSRNPLRLLALLASVLAACSPSSPGPKPVAFMAAPPEDFDLLGEFLSNLQVTTEVEQHAVRKPTIKDSVKAQIDAMVAHVRRHGRGEIEPADLAFTPPESMSGDLARERYRLAIVACRLIPYLDLESGPAQLSEVALGALGSKLGKDAAFRPARPEDRASNGELVSELRDGIGFMWVRDLDEDAEQRILAVLGQWKGAEKPPRALVLDLGTAEFGALGTVGVIVNALAPGKRAVVAAVRDPKEGIQMRTFQGQGAYAVGGYALMPLFIVTSPRTGSVAEALVHALRLHRGAHVLGGMTVGSGRLMYWQAAPPKGMFGFTIADLYGPNGTPLSGQPIVPDVCMTAKGLAALPDRTPEAYRALCDADGEISKENVLEFVRSAVAAEPPGGSSAGRLSRMP